MVSDVSRFKLLRGDDAFLSGIIEGLCNELLVEVGDVQEDIIAEIFELQSGRDTFIASYQKRMQLYIQTLKHLTADKREEFNQEINNVNFTLTKQESDDIVGCIIRCFGWAYSDRVRFGIEKFLRMVGYYLKKPLGSYLISGNIAYKTMFEVYFGYVPIGTILIQYQGYMIMLICVSD